MLGWGGQKTQVLKGISVELAAVVSTKTQQQTQEEGKIWACENEPDVRLDGERKKKKVVRSYGTSF